MRKIMVSFLGMLISVFVFGGCKQDEYGGTISGAECEYITVENRQYELCSDAPFHPSDQDKRIGKIKNGDMTFYLYSVKGTDQYIYCRWEWEGHMYKLVKD